MNDTLNPIRASGPWIAGPCRGNYKVSEIIIPYENQDPGTNKRPPFDEGRFGVKIGGPRMIHN